MADDSVFLIFSAAALSAYLFRAVKAGSYRAPGVVVPALLCLAVAALAPLIGLSRGRSTFCAVWLFLLLPPLFIKQAARALRLGRPRRASFAMLLAYVLRPTRQSRALRHTLTGLRALSSGRCSLAEVMARNSHLDPSWTRHQELLFLGYSYDVEVLYELLGTRREELLGSVFAASAVAALGELEGPAGVARAFEDISRLQRLQAPTSHNIWTVLLTAAHLGFVDLVRSYASLLRFDFTASRLVHAHAVALQRTGDSEQAYALLSRLPPQVDYRSAQEIRYRRQHPLQPSGDDNAAGDVASLDQRLRALLQNYYQETRIRTALRTPGWLTLIVAISLLLGFALQLHQGHQTWGLQHGAVAPFSLQTPWWHYLSYGWCHVDAGHLFVNLLALLYFGFAVEGLCGPAQLWTVYLGGVLAGGYAFALSHNNPAIALGASGGVMALFGATAAYLLGNASLRTSKEGRMHLLLILVMAVCQLLAEFAMDNSAASAHAGGAAWGFITTLLATKLNPKDKLGSPQELRPGMVS
jgi:membrane associated rhomboid family serine protease